MLNIIRTTIIGGVIFLIPIIVLVAVFGKALEITNAVATPMAAVLPVESIAGVAIVQLLAILLLLAICFVAGLIGRTAMGKTFVTRLEESFLSKLPPYALMKAKTQSLLSEDDIEGMMPVVARFDDSWQVAFEIERTESGHVVVFLPGAPDPWSGSVCVMTEDRIKALDMTIPIVAKMAKRLGRGTSDAVRDGMPAGAQTT